MINEKMKKLGVSRSTIRELFEYGKKLKAERGENYVFDYSLGNPSVAPPDAVNLGIASLLENVRDVELHGYTSAEGDINTRRAIAKYISEAFSAPASYEYVYMTAGAAGALVSVLGALTNENETVIALAPYFPEYKVFVERNGARLKPVMCKANDFTPDVDALDAAIDESVAAVIVNSPNNPTGAVYSEDDIKNLASLLERKSKQYGKPIYIIADEPYRELVYDGKEVPFIPNYYNNTVVCYSYSKSLSIPGERIGYAFVSPRADDAKTVMRAICGAGRALGYVCAPSLLQKLVPSCIGKTSDIKLYEENRRMLYEALTSYGFDLVYPSGAFYLFLKSPTGDAKEFSETAKKYGLLLVPSDDFGCEGYVRIAYCQSPDMILRSLPYFEKLVGEYKKESKNN
ncbi:MAG: pyridoxal phosphate-dependent aminotransferase [Clostridia bacterium]|nr:pyridoxal phosphate-dependent aminotransferase [Clostridia bacterium]